jgi:hypothetical protein
LTWSSNIPEVSQVLPHERRRLSGLEHGPAFVANWVNASPFSSFILSIILCSTCIAYDRPRLSSRHFLVFYLCSRVDPSPYNPARHPTFIETLEPLGSVLSYCFVLVVATSDSHTLPSTSPPLFSTYHSPDTSGAGGVRCLVHAACVLGNAWRS